MEEKLQEEIKELRRKLDLTETKGAEYINETLNLRKENEELKRIISDAVAAIYCKGHDTPEEWEALKILRKGL